MSGQVRPVYLHPGSQAEALAGALNRLGFTATVLKSRDYMQHPCVVVNCGRERHLDQTRYVFAAPDLNDGEGRWWFWRPSPHDPLVMEPVAPISDISVTADQLARTLTLFHHTSSQAS
jgi:hypothetical protein